MSYGPDSEAEDCVVEVFDTHERDNPKYGAVSIRLVKGMHGSVTRMTAKDAEILRDKLTAWLKGRP